MVRSCLDIVDAHDIIGRIFDRLLAIGCFCNFERVVLFLEYRVFGVPAAMDIAVDFLARLEGDDHVVRFGIFGILCFGSGDHADGGQCSQCTKEKVFHNYLRLVIKFSMSCRLIRLKHQNGLAAVRGV